MSQAAVTQQRRLDVSKDETAICVKGSDGRTAVALKKPTDPDAIATALLRTNLPICRVVMETGRMANWLYHELANREVPIVCIDARQAHPVLSQMHNKTDANNAAMSAELARTGFYRRVVVKSRGAQERRAPLRARDVAVTRYDRCPKVFLSAVALAATVLFWL